ncbi:tyrosine-protein phosphatase non-receptor type 23-like [Homarus americanus]|uniref:tyrosine-protein phosphatase non-receptor type 23-like n=1 Tax=Homarus americanus TaxID=6706 RepID=UPI001C4948EB|nr:tyrosine-protein phosphatase non-receptor type 23-like [Homarus americanus]
MEAVPRLPMLGFELKSSAESVEYGPKLRPYIRDHYNEDPESYSTEIHELEALRAGATHVPHDFTGCSTLKKYYCQLHFLLSRFPLTDNPAISVTFNWYDIYSSVVYNVTDIKYEMACILYNIGALHTDLGAMDARNTPDGMKISCTHFQCAAWAFQHLRETYPQPRETDLSPTLLTFMYNVALAQAQECILEKSMTDNRKPTIIAKVAMQVVEYLKAAMKSLWSGKSSDAVVTEIVGSRKLKMWRRYCEFKMSYHSAVALLYQGMQAEEQQKMGERLAYYQAAVDTLNEASKIAKNLEQQELIAESLTFSNDVMGGKLTAALKENEFVYHEKVPPIASLPEVKGASLVKGIPFSVTDPEVAGQDIFIKLVPMEAHQASSMYSEEKAKLLRRIGSAIQEKNEELETYLASMQLDSLALDSGSETLPQELIECCADLNASNGIKKLTDTMAKISSFFIDINAALEEIKRVLQEEDEKEKEFLAMMGKRAPNMIIGELKREANKYREAHQSAQDNNTALHRAITTHLAHLQLLSKPLDQVAAAIPSVANVEGQGDQASKQEVKRLMGKVSEMQAQRVKWESQLRTDIQDDDVTKQLVTNQDDMEDFFKNELKKHDKLVSLLEQNMAAQTNILQALSEANAAYATTRRLTNQVQAQRTETVSSLLASYTAYMNILKKAEDAQEFYRKLEGQVNKLASRVKSVCRVQDEEREDVLSANVKKFTASSVAAKVPSGPTASGHLPNLDTGGSTSSGPKLKDYLQHMKGGSVGVSAGLPAGMMTAANVQIQPGVPGYGYSDPSAYTSSMRPAPLGSEQSDPSTSCSGQGAGGYAVSYSSQAAAYRPSAPSPAPSPAPQISGSPYKAHATGTPQSTTGQYYPQHSGTSAYPGGVGVSGYPPAQSSTVPMSSAPSASYSSSSNAPHTASTTATQPSTYTASQSGSQHYGYNMQYPQYGYQNVPGAATVSASGLTHGMPHRSPLHGGTAGVHDKQVPHQPQYGYGAGYSATAPSTYGASAATSAGATSVNGSSTVGATRAPQPGAVGQTNMTQGYYGYYQQQQQPSTTSAASSAPMTIPSTASPQISSQPSHPTTSQSYPQYSYQYPLAQTSTSVPSMYSQAGSPHSANYRGEFSNQSGGVVYCNQLGYGNQGQTSGTQSPSVYSNQRGAGYPSRSYVTQATGTYGGGSYLSQPSTTSSTRPSGTPSTANAPPFGSENNPWNMYSSYPQAGIPSSITSQAGSAHTITSMSGGTNVKDMQQYPYSSATALTTASANVVLSTGTAQISAPASLPTAVSQNTTMYSQNLQHNQTYTQPMMWAQYSGQQQPYQHPQQHPQQQPQQHPQQAQQQPQQHPQQAQQQPQQHPQQAQHAQQQPQQHPQQAQQQPQQHPQQPQQHPTQSPQQYPQQAKLPPQQPLQPQPLQPQNKQKPSTTSGSAGPSVSSVTSGISNLDLLSGIELTSPPTSQWSPLTPQPAGTRQSADPGNVAAGGGGAIPTSAQSGTAPDVTSTAAGPSQMAPASVSNLPNIVSSNTAASDTAASDTATHAPGTVSSSILDLTVLAKSRKPTVVDPLSDDEKLQKLAVETERLSKIVEGLDRKSLNGPTNLELKWKELVEVVEKECGELKVSVARCYPLKNRFADILPYDHTRLTLPSARDDYINASYVQLKSTEESFPLILTQAPMPATFIDFWTMVWELQVETIVCLNSDAEVKGQVYVPSEVASGVDYGQFTITLHSCRQAGSPVSFQRILHMTHRTTKVSRVIIHLQFLGWPPSAMPESPSLLLQFLGEVHTFQRQQRNKLRPIVIHCVPGLGRSGVLTVLSAFVKEIHSSGSLLDLTLLVVDLSRQRRGGVQDKEHLHFLYSAALYYAQDVLMKRGILTNKATFEEGPREKTHVRHPSADLLSSYDLSRLKSKLGFDQESGSGRGGSEDERSRSNSVGSLLSNGSSAGAEHCTKEGQKEPDKDSVSSTGTPSSVCQEPSAVVSSTGGSALEDDSSIQPDKTSGILDSSFSALPPSLAASMDPQQFTLGPLVPGKLSKITKDSFENPAGALKKSDDPADPFSGLDPLWSHKKS